MVLCYMNYMSTKIFNHKHKIELPILKHGINKRPRALCYKQIIVKHNSYSLRKNIGYKVENITKKHYKH